MSAQLHKLLYVLMTISLTNATWPTPGIASRSTILNGQVLDDFPHNLPSTTTELHLQNNELRKFEYVDPYPNLYLLSVKNNLLNEFPDLVNISSTLTQLTLSGNEISWIEPSRLDQLSSLEYLYLDYNELDHIPDVPGPGDTLIFINLIGNEFQAYPSLKNLGRNVETLHLAENSIHDVTLGNLRQTPRLRGLNLEENPLTVIPNICQLNSTLKASPISWWFQDNAFVCNQSLVWSKISEMFGVTSYDHEPSCSTPVDLVGVDWNDIKIRDLLRTGSTPNFRGRTFVRVKDPDEFYCYPVIARTIQDTPLLICEAECLQLHGCAMFAADGGNCVITDFTATGSAADFLMYTDWFMVK